MDRDTLTFMMKGAFFGLIIPFLAVVVCLFIAEWERYFKVRNAQAKLNAQVILSQLHVERAKGIADANRIIGKSLKNNELYLRYLWIESLEHTKDKVIYVPIEGNMPVLEYCKKGDL